MVQVSRFSGVPVVEVLSISSFSRHLELFPSPQVHLETHSSKDPKPISAFPASFSHGPSRSLFADFAAAPENITLLTGRGEERTLGRMLFRRQVGRVSVPLMIVL